MTKQHNLMALISELLDAPETPDHRAATVLFFLGHRQSLHARNALPDLLARQDPRDQKDCPDLKETQGHPDTTVSLDFQDLQARPDPKDLQEFRETKDHQESPER